MKKIDFTKDQNKAIHTRGDALLVSASAGSGKTTVMVERIASMIAVGECSFGDILVLTFTNASASDMKVKLRRRLEMLGINTENLNEAAVGTFHKFCGEVVRTWFNIAGVSPDFTIIDEISSALLKQQVLNEVITLNYQKCAKAIETFCVNRKTDSFRKMIIRISEFLASRSDAEHWLSQTAVAAYETDIALDYILEYYSTAGAYFLKKFSNFAATKFSEECRLMAMRLASIKTYDDLHTFAIDVNFTRLSKCDDEEFKRTREQFREFVKKTQNFKIEKSFMTANGKRDWEIIKQVIHVVKEFEKTYAHVKYSANKLDFNDLEKFTCMVLDNAEIAAALRSKYKYIFIDEYQDTNPMQERILSSIAGNKNLFMVGDVKQSIYGFRGCEATIFAGKMTDFDTMLSGKVVCLNENFRSRANILRFANLVFGKVMKQGICDIDYNATSKFIACDDDKKDAVDVTLINTAHGSAAELQAAVISQKIADLTAAGVKLGDIAILARSRTHLAVLADTLESVGITVNIAAEQNACELFEIALLNNMLFAVSNFYNNVPLVLLMQSFVFGFTPNEMAEIKAVGGDEIFYKNLLKCKQLKKVAEFLEFLDKYQMLSKTHSVSDIITVFLTEFKVTERLLMLPKGKRMVSNINVYLNKMRGASYTSVISEFLYLLENELIEIKISTGSFIDDAVQIITMHSSKGLEFPYVIIFDVGAPFNLNDTKQLMVIDKKCGLCVYTLDSNEFTKTVSIARLGATVSARRVLIAEEMRLLYVAMTRAKQKLIIIGGASITRIPHGCEEFDILNAKSNLHFLAPALFETVRDNCFNLTVKDLDEIEIEKKNTEIRVLSGPVDEKLAADLRNLFTKKYPHTQAILKNSVSSLTYIEEENRIKGQGKEGTKYGTQFHKEMQNMPLEEIVKLIPEIKGYDIYREIVFLQSKGDIIVQGIIDLLAVKDGHAVIVDYKTTRATPEKLVQLYKPQLSMYAEAAIQAINVKRINVYIYSTFNKQLVEIIG